MLRLCWSWYTPSYNFLLVANRHNTYYFTLHNKTAFLCGIARHFENSKILFILLFVFIVSSKHTSCTTHTHTSYLSQLSCAIHTNKYVPSKHKRNRRNLSKPNKLSGCRLMVASAMLAYYAYPFYLLTHRARLTHIKRKTHFPQTKATQFIFSQHVRVTFL